MDLNDSSMPKENNYIYQYLYLIEVGLREFIIDKLSSNFGPRWWKQRLPEDIKIKCIDGRKYEKTITWCELIPHHPIYYTDFPDLKKIIVRNDNWNDIFVNYFSDKNIIMGTFNSIEPIRNKIAHNRKTTSSDLNKIKAAFETITIAIGDTIFSEFINRCTLAFDIKSRLIYLKKEVILSYNKCNDCESLEVLDYWNNICKEWWFDSEYLGFDLTYVQEYYDILNQYKLLPRYRGCGHKIEAWLKAKNIIMIFDKTINQLDEAIDLTEGSGE